ncbi:MAG: hypothetical protein AAGF13_01845 [Pseudomonadota bacterium]
MRFAVALGLAVLASQGAADTENVDLGCVPHFALSSEVAPPELAVIARNCLEDGVYGNAWAVWMQFEAYAAYDIVRVNDPAGHRVIEDIYSWSFISHDRKTMEELRAIVELFEAPGSPALEAVCEELRAKGPPSYVPAYMLAVAPSKAGGVELDAVAAWESALQARAGCPGA